MGSERYKWLENIGDFSDKVEEVPPKKERVKHHFEFGSAGFFVGLLSLFLFYFAVTDVFVFKLLMKITLAVMVGFAILGIIFDEKKKLSFITILMAISLFTISYMTVYVPTLLKI